MIVASVLRYVITRTSTIDLRPLWFYCGLNFYTLQVSEGQQSSLQLHLVIRSAFHSERISLPPCKVRRNLPPLSSVSLSAFRRVVALR